VNRQHPSAFAAVAATIWSVGGVPLLVIGLIWLLFGERLSSFRPYLNDEVAYWHQILTFSRVGFHGGYYTLGELTNPSGFTPFGPHGPGFAVLYGSLGTVLGWYRHSIVVLNLAFVACAAWAYLALARLTPARAFLFGTLLVTFWPLILWVPTGMQEGLHYAGAVALAGLFARALQQPPRVPVIAAGWAMLAVLAYIRPSWLILLPIWAIVVTRTNRMSARVVTLAASGAVAAVLLLAYNRSTAPYPSGFFFLRAFSPEGTVLAIAENLVTNLKLLLGTRDFNALEQIHRLQYVGWIAAGAVIGVVMVRHSRTSTAGWHVATGTVAMAAALGLLLAVYAVTNWADHRVLSAFLLFAAALAAAAPGRGATLLVAALIASNLFVAPTFIRNFEDLRSDNFVWDRRGWREFQEAIQGRVAYHADRSRWCNTLLTAQYPPYLIAVPGGIGLSVVREGDQLALPPRSGYLLLDDVVRSELKRPVKMSEIARFAFGTLYVNEEAGCE
jgi:hypothetical protein